MICTTVFLSNLLLKKRTVRTTRPNIVPFEEQPYPTTVTVTCFACRAPDSQLPAVSAKGMQFATSGSQIQVMSHDMSLCLCVNQPALSVDKAPSELEETCACLCSFRYQCLCCLACTLQSRRALVNRLPRD